MKFATALKKHLKLALGLIGLAAVVVWSGGFLGAKTKPGKLAHAAGFAVPAGAATIEVKAETAPVRVEVVGTSASEEKINLSARIPATVEQADIGVTEEVEDPEGVGRPQVGLVAVDHHGVVAGDALAVGEEVEVLNRSDRVGLEHGDGHAVADAGGVLDAELGDDVHLFGGVA